MMSIVYIGCDLSNQCRNYKMMCGECSDNWELENNHEYECYADDCNVEEDDE